MALKDFVKTEYTPEQLEAQKQQEMKDAFMEESGLEGADVNKLRSTMLSAEEAIAAKTEQMNDIRARKGRKKDWDEFVDAKRRWGKAMHHSDILRGLYRMIPGLYVCDGLVRNTLGLYIWDRSYPFEIDAKKRAKIGGTIYLGWMHLGYSPEYEIDITDEVGVAKRQLRGWRTMLLRMQTLRDPETFFPKPLATEAQVVENFGLPTNGPTASEYRRQLYEFRNTTPERAKLNHELLQAAARFRYA